jgi:hypothetical protein
MREKEQLWPMYLEMNAFGFRQLGDLSMINSRRGRSAFHDLQHLQVATSDDSFSTVVGKLSLQAGATPTDTGKNLCWFSGVPDCPIREGTTPWALGTSPPPRCRRDAIHGSGT